MEGLQLQPAIHQPSKSRQAHSYWNKCHIQPDFYETEKQRVAAYIKGRYHHDPEFRQRVRARTLRYYYRRKAQQLADASKEYCTVGSDVFSF